MKRRQVELAGGLSPPKKHVVASQPGPRTLQEVLRVQRAAAARTVRGGQRVMPHLSCALNFKKTLVLFCATCLSCLVSLLGI